MTRSPDNKTSCFSDRFAIRLGVALFFVVYICLAYAVFFAQNTSIFTSSGRLSFGSYTLAGMFATLSIGLIVVAVGFIKNHLEKR